jgi:hypothetical protein
MFTFDYTASAELFATQGRSGFRYRRFAQAAEAIRYDHCCPNVEHERRSNDLINKE